MLAPGQKKAGPKARKEEGNRVWMDQYFMFVDQYPSICFTSASGSGT